MVFRFVLRSDRRISKQANAFWHAEIPVKSFECALDELEAKIAELMETIQKDMLEKARKHRESHTYVAKNMEEMGNIIK